MDGGGDGAAEPTAGPRDEIVGGLGAGQANEQSADVGCGLHVHDEHFAQGVVGAAGQRLMQGLGDLLAQLSGLAVGRAPWFGLDPIARINAIVRSPIGT
jgi:hypothetical protein